MYLKATEGRFEAVVPLVGKLVIRHVKMFWPEDRYWGVYVNGRLMDSALTVARAKARIGAVLRRERINYLSRRGPSL